MAGAHAPCCGPFLLKYDDEEAFVQKLLALLTDIPGVPATEKDKAVMRATVRDLLIFTSKREDVADAESRVANAFAMTHAQYMNTPAKTAFFWDPDQYETFKGDNKLLLIKGGKC